jgi:hypothetical protein
MMLGLLLKFYQEILESQRGCNFGLINNMVGVFFGTDFAGESAAVQVG